MRVYYRRSTDLAKKKHLNDCKELLNAAFDRGAAIEMQALRIRRFLTLIYALVVIPSERDTTRAQTTLLVKQRAIYGRG